MTNEREQMADVMQWAEARRAEGVWVDSLWMADGVTCVCKMGNHGDVDNFLREVATTELAARLALMQVWEEKHGRDTYHELYAVCKKAFGEYYIAREYDDETFTITIHARYHDNVFARGESVEMAMRNVILLITQREEEEHGAGDDLDARWNAFLKGNGVDFEVTVDKHTNYFEIKIDGEGWSVPFALISTAASWYWARKRAMQMWAKLTADETEAAGDDYLLSEETLEKIRKTDYTKPLSMEPAEERAEDEIIDRLEKLYWTVEPIGASVNRTHEYIKSINSKINRILEFSHHHSGGE